MKTLSQIIYFLHVLLMEGKFGWLSCEKEGLGKKKKQNNLALYGNTGHKKDVRDLIKMRRELQ